VSLFYVTIVFIKKIFLLVEANMIIKPSIRSNLFTNSHPDGCGLNVLNQISEAKGKEKFEGPKNVLIIGGSSGYGLASRISLAFGSNSNTINVCFESAPKGKRSGTAGFWNNVAFQKHVGNNGSIHTDFIGDAFSSDMKLNVLNYIKSEFGNIDLLVYSVAAGARKNEELDELVYSKIKSVGKEVTGKTIDISSNVVKELTITGATDSEIKDTVYVMGGSDWSDWVNYLDENEALNNGVKTIAYTYIGGETTKDIYRDGTLGKAKVDLETVSLKLNELLNKKYNGESLISSSKAVATKASIYIPQMPIYVACLYEVMMNNDVHESILEHKYRLFKDMVYGNKRENDEKNRLRVDSFELSKNIQNETNKLMTSLSDDELLNLPGTKVFLKDLFQLNGFGYESIDYDKDINIESVKSKYKYHSI